MACYDVSVLTRARALLIVVHFAALFSLGPALFGQAPGPATSLTLLSRDGRRAVATTAVDGREMIGLDDLAPIFQLSVREDAAVGAVTVSYKGQTIVLTPDQTLVSVGGKLVSLSAPLRRAGRRWLVPIDFLNRALALVYDTRIELRPGSRLATVGDLRVPRIQTRYDALSNVFRITVDISPKAGNTVVREQSRLLINFEADAIDAVLPPLPSQDFLANAAVAESGTGIQFELGPRFASYRTSSSSSSNTSDRLVIEFQPAANDTSAAPAIPAPSNPPAFLGAAAQSAIQAIVLDPGHGGEDTGVHGASGAFEKDIALSVARRLKTAIEGRLGIRTLLTRDDDRQIDLDERAAIANNNQADLFISLHANASVQPAAKGAEVFYLGLDRFAEDARREATSPGELVPVFGGGTREISPVQWELAQAKHLDDSAKLAGIIEQQLRERVEVPDVVIQRAPMRVLAGANMPAVLVEMGYLSNPEQGETLGSSAFQNLVVQALLEAVVAFRDYLEHGPVLPPAIP